MAARRYAYRIGILKRHKLSVPLVVVGNISVGGTGKTPLVIELVESFKLRGMKPGVVSRGYRGRRTNLPCVVDESVVAEQVGDEPLLIFRRCQVPVMVGRDRVRGACALIDAHGCDIIISDDGFQHYALARDLDIVVIDGARRFGNGWCLPAGPLREPQAALKRAGIIVVNGERHVNADANTDTNTSIQVSGKDALAENEFAMTTHLDHVVRLDNAQIGALRDFANQTVHAVTGIGNPSKFFRQLEAHGITVIPHEYPDHHPFTPADFAFAAQDDAAVLVTEKDAVKFQTPNQSLTLPPPIADRCWVVPLCVNLGADLLPAIFTRVLR